ncbi:LysM domain-containing protein [Akanthomyces lecanii RCEF 1005]|uniref:LysM domain-containing protein n=1 Tax=Akanthomyces lecanii RCEF 1005 TaxID=1081108 RepID=A0A168G6P6_CORDF|nr:LysM domain-containing protein [Akanthomyces lecanii RCEF 1005]
MMQAYAAAAVLALLRSWPTPDAPIAIQNLIWENISGKAKMPSDPKTVNPCNVRYNNNGTVDCESVIFQTSTDRILFLNWYVSSFSLTAFRGHHVVDQHAASHHHNVDAAVHNHKRWQWRADATAGAGVMVGNCNSFHYIYKGNMCGQITSYHSITQEQFARWNPKVGMEYSGLWADTYACVGVIGEDQPTPTPTATPNGIQTPQPTQGNMVKNCNQCHYI